MKLTWGDWAAVARDLATRNPERDPLALSLGELRRLVIALPSFGDEADAGTDQDLEEIQGAWYDIVQG